MMFPIARGGGTSAVKWAELVLGAWLFASAFLLPHSGQSFGNTWVVGLMTVVVAVISFFGSHKLLRPNAVFSAWLLVSTMLVPYASSVTRLHNALIAIALIILSLIPARYLVRPEGAGAEPQKTTA